MPDILIAVAALCAAVSLVGVLACLALLREVEARVEKFAEALRDKGVLMDPDHTTITHALEPQAMREEEAL